MYYLLELRRSVEYDLKARRADRLLYSASKLLLYSDRILVPKSPNELELYKLAAEAPGAHPRLKFFVEKLRFVYGDAGVKNPITKP